MKQIRIVTRASRLALAQTNQCAERLSALAPDGSIEIVKISTKGDRDKSDFLYQSGSVGFFTSEVERALLSGQGDIAVHSLKDLPTAAVAGLTISAIPLRESVCDVVVATRELSSIHDLPPHAAVGTSSIRRMAQLKRLRPDLDCRPLRGNVETRIRQVQTGQVDAIVVAQAGLNRLGLSDHISLVLPPTEFPPSPGQGALAVQIRQGDTELGRLVAGLDDPHARITAQAERRILAGLHGGCNIPLGVYSHIEKGMIHIHALLCSPDESRTIQQNASGSLSKAMEIAEAITRQILEEGGGRIIDRIHREKKTEN